MVDGWLLEDYERARACARIRTCASFAALLLGVGCQDERFNYDWLIGFSAW